MEKMEKKNTERKRLVGTRGRTFKGQVVKKFEKRIVVDLERTVKIKKYERFMKKKTRIHARILDGTDVHVGDVVKVRECRPLSKITHFMFVEKLSSENNARDKK